MARLTGTVARVILDKGFGFVKAASGKEFFFHRTAVDNFDGLREGQAVTFEEGMGAKGPRAEHLELA
jgi:CspA family cold shock protein